LNKYLVINQTNKNTIRKWQKLQIQWVALLKKLKEEVKLQKQKLHRAEVLRTTQRSIEAKAAKIQKGPKGPFLV